MIKVKSTVEIVKLAQKDQKFRSFLLKLAQKSDNSQFNEEVPANEQEEYNEQGGPVSMKNAVPLNGANPVGSSPAGMEQSNVNQMLDENMMNDPGMMGATAAQQFLGPVFDAAMQGDQSAIEIISRTAGQIANNASQGSMMPQMDAGQGAMGYEDNGQYAAVPNSVGLTPEEELANRIMGPGAETSPNTGSSVEPDDVSQVNIPKEASDKSVTMDDIRGIMKEFAK